MKKLILLLLFFVVGITKNVAQSNQDAVYLKNGKVIQGVVIEQVHGLHIKIQTSNGSVFYVEYADIEKISQIPIADEKEVLPEKEKGRILKKIKENVSRKLEVKSGNNWIAKVGLGCSNVSGNYMKFSFRIGAEYDFSFSKNFSIMPGLYFTNKGFADDTDIYNACYLELPISIAAKVKITDKMTFSPKVGPYLAYGLVGSICYGYDYDDKFEYNYKGLYFGKHLHRRFDFGVTAGLSVDYFQFSLGLEYTRGFIDIDAMGDGRNEYNQAVIVVLGYKF